MDELYLDCFPPRRRRLPRSATGSVGLGSAPARVLATLIEPKDARLFMEFMGLANHRKEIRAEIAAWSERWREEQISALKSIVREYGSDSDEFPPAGLAVVIAAIGRTLILEQGLGSNGGHAQPSLGRPIPRPVRDADRSSPRSHRAADPGIRAAPPAAAPSRARSTSALIARWRSRCPIPASD